MPPLVGKNISILRGLDGQDNHIESLMALWEQLQLSAVEVAAQPECDLISFAQTAFFFGIITWGTHNDFIQPRVPSQTVTAAPQTNTMPWPASRPVPDPWSWEPEGSKTTDELLNKLEELKPGYDAYLKLQKRIESRPSEPQNVWKYGSNSDLESWFSEGQSSRQVQQAEPVAANSLPIFTPTLASVPIASTRAPTSNPYATIAPRGLAQQKPLGIIYLVASPFTQSAPNQVGELNLGIILDTPHRGQGYAREAIDLLVKHAFEVERCHRIQASLLNLNNGKDRMVSLLTQLRFGHEGTRRRAFYHPLVKEWQDMTTLAILDTDWALRSVIRSAPKSLWDEMFLRHERERDELLRWENRSLKRSASTETIRVGGGGADPVDTDSSAASDSEHSSVESSRSKGKRRKVEEDPYDGSSSDYDTAGSDYAFSELDVVQFDGRTPSPAPSDLSAESVPPSPAPSDWSVESHPLSPVSSAGEWEVLDSYGVDE